MPRSDREIRRQLGLENTQIFYQDKLMYSLAGQRFASCGSFHYRVDHPGSKTGKVATVEHYFYWSTEEGLLLSDPADQRSEDLVFGQMWPCKSRIFLGNDDSGLLKEERGQRFRFPMVGNWELGCAVELC